MVEISLIWGEPAQQHSDWEAPSCRLPQLAKTLHTERHRKLRELLVAQRKAAGLTQTVLAQRLGKPPSYVAKYELGERRLDVLEYLDIAAEIGFDPREPIGGLAERVAGRDAFTPHFAWRASLPY